ncbi:MAG: aminoacyl-tRNA hydrolase [Chthoniobacterales bacterium]|nr:aminoacyl-tRNA hydrolase [Chthoniobacterales bacterium]
MRVVVGLGNPGKEYEHSRHNLGFEAVEIVGREFGAEWKFERRWGAEVGVAGEVFLLKPMTWMNLSGEAVASFCNYLRISASEILVILDDMWLKVGQIRLRGSGSSGGHKGLSSILERMGTHFVPRLRIGIGSPPRGGDAAEYVLQVPPEEERKILETALSRVPTIVRIIFDKGLEAAMNFVNSKPKIEDNRNESIRSFNCD